MSKFRTDIMRPIVEDSDFRELYNSGLILFDYLMSEGNRYMFNIPVLVELAKQKMKTTDYDSLIDSMFEISSEIYIPIRRDELKKLFTKLSVTFRSEVGK